MTGRSDAAAQRRSDEGGGRDCRRDRGATEKGQRQNRGDQTEQRRAKTKRTGSQTTTLRRSVAPSLRSFLLTTLIFCITTPLHAAEPLEKTTRKGPVEAVVRLEPIEPVIGDAVVLTLRVTAQKGVELLMPDFGQAMERYAILDYSTRAQIDDEGRTVMTQVYELQPPRSGKQSIPSIMIEFVDRRDGAKPAPDGMDAYELLTERLGFEVRSVLPDDAAAELNPPLLEQLTPAKAIERSVWPWIVAAVLVIVAGGVGWRFLAAARRQARRRSAYDIAIGRLHQLLNRLPLAGEQMDAFFVELSSIVRWYLETRFELRAPELTTEEFLSTMSQSPDLTRDHQSLLREFLRRADLVKFANFVPDEGDIDDSVSAARRFLEETQDAAPLIEPPDALPQGPEDRPPPPMGPAGGKAALQPPQAETTRV